MIIDKLHPLLSNRKSEGKLKRYKRGLALGKKKKDKRKHRTTAKQRRTQLMNERADRLNANLPKSELWFWNLYRNLNLVEENDFQNRPWEWVIPDVINHELKYVIEIDGSIHNNEEQKIIDQNKDKFYKQRNYEVFRIIAYCEKSFNEAMDKLKIHRAKFSKIKLRKKNDPKLEEKLNKPKIYVDKKEEKKKLSLKKLRAEKARIDKIELSHLRNIALQKRRERVRGMNEQIIKNIEIRKLRSKPIEKPDLDEIMEMALNK